MDPVSITLTAVGWLMSALVSKAVTALLEAWAKRIGLGNEFKTLKDQLLQLDALLTSIRGHPTDNDSLKDLVLDLQQLAYQAENLLDELDYYRLKDEIQHRGTQQKVNCSNKSSAASSSSGFRLAGRSILSTLKGMSCCSAQDVQGCEKRINLSQRMKDLAEQLQKSVCNVMQIESQVRNVRNTEISQSEATNNRQTTEFPTEPIVFGRDQEHYQLVNLLTNNETAIVGKVPVLAIVGSGGVGKTTLAKLVFNDEKVQSYFQVRLWIYVSTRFDIDRLTRMMLEGTCRTGCNLTNLSVLQNKLKNELGSKRFLFVFDDMWEDKNKSQWEVMVAPLNSMRNGSIILVTTRNESVAKMVDARDNIIHLQGLGENAFLSFFNTCIFKDPNHGENSTLRKIGREIANKLKGNPLAAKTVSAMLKENPDVGYWMKIRDREEWKSMSGPDDIMPALKLSYVHMPFHLQRCFSYCAILPEDHTFTCEELVYQWMAQGYLDVKGKRMEDIGREYFNDLFNYGVFQIIQSQHDNEVHYTFHDLIHDLAHMVAIKECLTINGPDSGKIPPTIHRLSIFNSKEIAINEEEIAKNEEEIVRALECFKGENLSTIFHLDKLPSRISCSILNLLNENKFLRAVRLDSPVQLHNCKFQNFVSLRYLRLIMSDFHNCKTLPSEICRLYHLEVLEIKDGRLLDELPNNFSDLVSLRHFIVEEGWDSKNPLHSKIWGVGKLTSLQELNHFDVQQKKGYEIEQLGSLKEIGGLLKIRNLENVKSKEEANKARLAEKKKLDALYLKWNHGKHENENVLEGLKPNTNVRLLEIDGYGGVASPRWLDSSLIFLESLTLKDCKAWDLLPPIGELEFLKHLELSGMAVRKIGNQCHGTCQSIKFPSLKVLNIIDMSSLESLDLHSFVALEKLDIKCCQSLTSLTFGEHLVRLKILKIISCKTLSSMEGLKYLVKLKMVHFQECPDFIAAWDTASKEIESTELDFSSSLKKIKADSLGLLTFPICKQLTSLQYFELEVSPSTEEHEVSLQLLTSINLVDVRGCKKNLQSFPFDLFPSLKILVIKFPHIQSISTNSRTEITDECLKLTNIKQVHIMPFQTNPYNSGIASLIMEADMRPVEIRLALSSEQMLWMLPYEEFDD